MTNSKSRKKSWNDRYKSPSNQPLQPEPFLIDHVSRFKPGSVLDIACGTGRNSVFLSKNGFKVTSVDFSEIALARLSENSHENNLSIETIKMDLSQTECFKKLKKVDNIIVIHYKLKDDLLEQIPSLLNNHGIFLYCTFNLRQLELRTFPREFCLKQGELVNKKWELKLLKYTTFKNKTGYHDGYLFQK